MKFSGYKRKKLKRFQVGYYGAKLPIFKFLKLVKMPPLTHYGALLMRTNIQKFACMQKLGPSNMSKFQRGFANYSPFHRSNEVFKALPFRIQSHSFAKKTKPKVAPPPPPPPQTFLSFPLAKAGHERLVGYWLLGSSALTAGVMGIGAYVRLNESGLSMLDWKLLGLPLPSNDEEWNKEFDKYKATPEYVKVHYDITLDEYKKIYFNEWIHRMAGRTAGGLHFAGAVALGLYGALRPGAFLLVLATSGLGISQAFVGKWMVETGFQEPITINKTPRVSPYSLCMHHLNALGIYSLCLLNSLKLLSRSVVHPTFVGKPRVKVLAGSSAVAVLCAMIYGTIVAGNDAGYAYNTWPKMLDKYIPDEIYKVQSWKQPFEDTALVQFTHRTLGYIVVALTSATFIASRTSTIPRKVRALSTGLWHASLLQAAVGILTLVKQVPLHAAMTHQVGALALWSVVIALLQVLK